MNKKKNKTYHEDLIEILKDPEEAVGYLKAALEESDVPEVFLIALRDVAEAYGMAQLARKSKLNRENLYRMLSKQGNPEFSSLQAILNALNFKLSVELKAS